METKKPEIRRSSPVNGFQPFPSETMEIPMIPWDAGTKVEQMLQRVRMESLQQKAIIENSEDGGYDGGQQAAGITFS